MRKIIFIMATLVLVFISTLVSYKIKNKDIYKNSTANGITAPMPLVVNDPLAVKNNLDPIEQRGPKYANWLSKGLKISVSGASGSGTIIYYDKKSGWAYVQSCGHLWNGNRSVNEGRHEEAVVTTWYHNNKKLKTPKSYNAEVLFYSNHNNPDISLLRFKPDWKPDYFPIAPENYKIGTEQHAHSIGCDGGREIAHYDVEIIKERENYFGKEIVTAYNSPRPGRSGGGLISDEGYYIGICWGTSNYSGNGSGYFTSLEEIHKIMKREGFEWLLNVKNSLARQIPIIDRNNPQQEYSEEYIAIPR